MANPSVLPQDMKLYCVAEPAGRVFFKGEPWPGDAWSAKPGGDDAGAKTVAAAMGEIEDVQRRFSDLQSQYGRLEHDLAQAAKDRDEAVAENAALKQAAADAANTGDTAAEEAKEAAQARDQAIADATGYREKADALTAKVEEQIGAIDRLTSELSAAQQAAADASGRVQELETDLGNANAKVAEGEGLLTEADKEIKRLKAEIAKVDGDGDGKVGGSAAKK